MSKKSDGPSAMVYVLFAVILGIFYVYKEQNEEIKKNEYVPKQNKLPEWKIKTPVNIPKNFDFKSKLYDSISLPKFPKAHINNTEISKKLYDLQRKENFEYELKKSGIISDSINSINLSNNLIYLQKKSGLLDLEISKKLYDTSKKFDGSLLKK